MCGVFAQTLYARDLIRTISVNVRAPGGGGSRIKTTMLQLPRFLLKLEPGQMLRVGPFLVCWHPEVPPC